MKFFSNISFFTPSRMNDRAQVKSFVKRKSQSVQEGLHHTRHFTLRFCIPFLFFLILSTPVFSQSTIFVDVDATGANDGSSWGDAYTTLQDALADPDLGAGDHIWVAEGIYYPDEGGGQTDNDRSAHFQLINGVSLYGGFEGDESHINERNWGANVTILSGDIDGNDTTTGGIITDTDDINGNNSYSVVVGTHTNMSARLDGFTITGGKADHAVRLVENHGGGIFSSDGRPTVANVILIGNMAMNGGGMANHDNGSATLTNVHFINNEATNFGGGMYNIESNPTLTNVIFSENFSQNNGGGLFNHTGSDPVLVNALFSENEAANNGGAMQNRDSSSPELTNVTIAGNISAAGNIGGIYNGASSEATLDNVIIWGNFSGGDTDVLSASINTGNGANPTIANSLIAHSGGSSNWNSDIGTNGGGNLDTDPIFTDIGDPDGPDNILGTSDDGLTLFNTSPAVNAGDNSAIPGGIPTDLAGNDRIFAGTPNPDVVDMGAYELQEEAQDPVQPDADNILYVDQNDFGGDQSGRSWGNAMPDLRKALNWARNEWNGSGPPLQIWVADGVYLPTGNSTNRTASFRLVNNVEIYGGFNGGESNLGDRDWETHITVLSGDIAGDDNTDANGVLTDTDDIAGPNSFHVVIGSGTNATAVLDGFFITGGQANGGSSPNDLGGGMYTQTGSPTLARLHFSGNRARLGGGVVNRTGASPSLTNVSFRGNRANVDGGGMYNLAESSPTLTNVSFSGNQAGTRGGGVRNTSNSSPTLTNVIFSGNQAVYGGGMFNGHACSPVLINVSFTGNQANNVGGAMVNEISSHPTLVNTIIWGNQANGNTNTISASIANVSGSTPIIDYSLVANCNSGGSWQSACGTNGGNNLPDAAPLFVDPINPADAPASTGNLRLQTGSPAINAGDNAPFESGGVAEDVVSDLAGNNRIFDNGTVDLGAYEFQGESQTDLDLTLTIAEGWRLLASPFDGLTYDTMIGELWTQGFPGSDYPSAEFANVYTWPNDQTGNDPGDWVPIAGQTDPIPAGTGFLIQIYADDNFDGTVEGSEEFDKTIQLNGGIRTGDVSPSMNTTTDGWTLVGNPYSDPVDFSNVFSSSGGLTGAAYVFDSNYTGSAGGDTNGNPGGWRSTDGIYGDLVDGIIAPAQGFFVQNSGSSGSLTFTEASKTTGGGFYGKKKELRDFVRLEVQGEAGVNAAWIRFSEEGSDELMHGDALELQPYTEHYTLLGARKAGGTMLDIAHFPLPDQETEIPLSVETTLSGAYHITATKLDLPAGTQLYLHDKETGEALLIDEGMSYTFDLRANEDLRKIPPYQGGTEGGVSHVKNQGHTSSSAQAPKGQTSRSTVAGTPQKATTVGNDRFLITTTSETPTTEIPEKVALGQNYPNPFNPSTVINYQLPASSQVRLEVYDMIGRRVATLVDGQVAAGTHQVNFNAGNLSSGVYLYRLTARGANGSNKIFTKKLTLIK